MPTCLMIAGPNGAGKSTFTNEIHGDITSFEYINPDEIAARMRSNGKGTSESSIQIAAGKEAIKRIRECMKNGRSFATETTLSSNQSMDVLRQAKDRSYVVEVIYLGVRSPGVSVNRVAVRVQQGGHNVESDVVVRRFGKSLENLKATVHLADAVHVLDNTQGDHRTVLQCYKGKVVFIGKDFPNWLQPITENLEHRKELLDSPASYSGLRQKLDRDKILEPLSSAGFQEATVGRMTQHTGTIISTSEHHVVQEVGGKRIAIHAIAALSETPEVGKRVVVQYSNGVGMVREFAPNRSRER